MLHVLKEVFQLVEQYRCKLVIAGDVFHRPNPPPELINWVLRILPWPCYVVPGQHDLFHHRYDSWPDTALGTLVQSGRVYLLEPNKPVETPEVVLYGFPWGTAPQPCPPRHELDDRPHLAVVHRYCWVKGAGFPGAPDDARIGHLLPNLAGYDAVVVGDNHIPWHRAPQRRDEPYIYNNGAVCRRNSPEQVHPVQVGLLHRDGSVSVQELGTEEEQWHDLPRGDSRAWDPDFSDVVEDLRDLGAHGLEFPTAVERYCDQHRVRRSVRKIIDKTLEEE